MILYALHDHQFQPICNQNNQVDSSSPNSIFEKKSKNCSEFMIRQFFGGDLELALLVLSVIITSNFNFENHCAISVLS